jgi:hypothetical protein
MWGKTEIGHLSSWVKIRLHIENQLPGLPVNALKVSVVVWWCGVSQPITLSIPALSWGWVGLWKCVTKQELKLWSTWWGISLATMWPALGPLMGSDIQTGSHLGILLTVLSLVLAMHTGCEEVISAVPYISGQWSHLPAEIKHCLPCTCPEMETNYQLPVWRIIFGNNCQSLSDGEKFSQSKTSNLVEQRWTN